MALPQSISGDLEPCGPPMKAPNGAIYLVVADSTSVEMWKLAAPDSGSWAEQDASNKPTAGATNAIDYMHACQYEHLIFMAYGVLNGSEHDIVAKMFDTSTDTWVSGTQTIYSGGPGEIPGAWHPCALVATPNYLYCLHESDSEKIHGTTYTRVMVSYRNLSGTTWTNSSTIVAGVSVDYIPWALVANSSENAVAFYGTGSVGYGVVWDRSSLGTASNNTSGSPPAASYVFQQAVSYMDGSTNRIIVSGQTASNFYATRWTSSGTTITSVADTVIEATSVNGFRGGMARWGTTLYAWYVNSSNNPAYEDSSDHGANWSGAEFSNPSNNVTANPWANAYTRKGTLKIGIVYKEGTTQLSYGERTISTPSAPSFSSAKTPTRQNRILVSA